MAIKTNICGPLLSMGRICVGHAILVQGRDVREGPAQKCKTIGKQGNTHNVAAVAAVAVLAQGGLAPPAALDPGALTQTTQQHQLQRWGELLPEATQFEAGGLTPPTQPQLLPRARGYPQSTQQHRTFS